MGMLQHLCWLMILLGVSHSCPNPDTILPCQCANHGTEVQIWCSHSEVSRVLAGLQAVATEMKQPIDELILENNALPSLPGRTFESLKVVRLMLRENGLQRVTANWLAGLEDSLVELFVVEPELRGLPEDSLEGLARLEAVTLEAGGVTRLPRLAGLLRLRYLHARLPLLTDLRLQALPALEQATLSDAAPLQRLEADALRDLPRLLTLNITRCGLAWVHPRALVALPSLVDLSFAANRLADPGLVGHAVRELPSLSVLRLDGNIIDKLPETTFVDIPSLREIHLQRNQIVDIHRGAFHRLPALKLLDLNHNKIRRIHTEFFLQPFDSGLEELRLVHNELDDVMQLRIILEALPRLRFLDLSSNRLHDITYGALRGHMALERLHLDHNRLRRVVREAFIAMPALRELRLSNNSLSNYLEMPLWNLPALKGLDISFNEFHRLDRRMLANIPSLRRLDVSGNALVTVDAAAFLATPALEHVNLSRNALQDFSPATFPHLMKLFELDVSSNRLRTLVPNLPVTLEYFHIAKNHISSMPSADNRLSALKYLDISGNGINRFSDNGLASMPLLKTILAGENSLQSVEENTLQGLNRLEVLDLHNNRLMTVHERAFRDLRRLNSLNLQGNRLDSLSPRLFQENVALRVLDLSWNQLANIPESCLNENRALEELLISHNSLSSLPADVSQLRQLRVLDASHNRVSSLAALQGSRLEALAELNLGHNQLGSLTEAVVSDMPSLVLLDLHANQLQYMAPHAIRAMPNLTAVRLGQNHLTALPSAAFSSLPSLLSAELQENEITDVASDAFTSVPNLIMLNLSYNHLTGMERAGLSGLHSLEVLDLSHNQVTHFDTNGLPNLQALVHLKMDDNKMCDIIGSPFRKMSRLRVLSLRNNKISSLPEVTFKPLRHTMYSLDVEGNPLQCSCGMGWLRAWMHAAPYLSAEPRCHDGSLLRNARTDQECRHESVLEPGCELDYSGGIGYTSGVGPTQQLSSYIDSSSKETTIRPLPEESEYFYEDFVEYEENSTLPFNLSQQSTYPSTDSSVPTIPPGVLSHFIPGDTPTLYAGTHSSPSTTPPSPSGYTRQPSSAFTFFGMPLPSLGSFWGSGRDTDGRGRFTSSRGRGRVQQLPPVMQDGFQPIVPGAAGGFRPNSGPFNSSAEDYNSQSQSQSISQESLYNHSHTRPEWDNSLPHAVITKVEFPSHKKKLYPELDIAMSTEEDNRPDSIWSSNGSESQSLSESEGVIDVGSSGIRGASSGGLRGDTSGGIRGDSSGGLRGDSNGGIRGDSSGGIRGDSNGGIRGDSSGGIRGDNSGGIRGDNSGGDRGESSSEEITKPPPLATVQEMAFAISLPESSQINSSLGNLKSTSITTKDEKNNTFDKPQATITTTSSSFLSDLWGAVNYREPTGKGPTSLSEFLAPGDPVAVVKPTGRSTITKVTVPPPLGPGPVPMAEDLQGPIPRLAKSPPQHYYHEPERNHSMDWYYSNYNNSELEPYVGPGKVVPVSGAPATIDTPLFALASVYVVFIMAN